jgi:hypothetical protein
MDERGEKGVKRIWTGKVDKGKLQEAKSLSCADAERRWHAIKIKNKTDCAFTITTQAKENNEHLNVMLMYVHTLIQRMDWTRITHH